MSILFSAKLRSDLIVSQEKFLLSLCPLLTGLKGLVRAQLAKCVMYLFAPMRRSLVSF